MLFSMITVVPFQLRGWAGRNSNLRVGMVGVYVARELTSDEYTMPQVGKR